MQGRPWRVFALISGAVVQSTLNFSIIFVAFPEIEATFVGVGAGRLSWALTGYTIVLAALLVPVGWLADRVGRRRVFLSGVGVFAVSSVAVGVAPTPELLIAARALQAAGSAMQGPSGIALLLQEFPASKRSTAVGAFGAIAGVGAALGPVIGGVLIEWLSWRWTFVLNAPLGLVIIVIGRRMLVESGGKAAAGPPDFLGAGVLMAGVAALAFGIVQSEAWGWADTRIWVAWVMAVSLVVWFVQRCRHHPSPVVDLVLFRDRNYTLANLMGLLNVGSFSAMYLGLVLFLMDVWEYSTRDAGLLLALIPGVAGPLSAVAGRLADRIGHRAVILPGALCTTASMVWFLLGLTRDREILTYWVPALGLYSVGVGLGFAAAEAAAVHGLAQEHLGVGAAVHRIFGEIGATLAVAVAVVLVDGPDATETLLGYRRLGWMMVGVGVATALLALPLDTRPATRRRRRRRPSASVQRPRPGGVGTAVDLQGHA